MTDKLAIQYAQRYERALAPLSIKLEKYINKLINDHNVQPIDRVILRPKSVERFLQKAKKIEDRRIKYKDPIS